MVKFRFNPFRVSSNWTTLMFSLFSLFLSISCGSIRASEVLPLNIVSDRVELTGAKEDRTAYYQIELTQD